MRFAWVALFVLGCGGGGTNAEPPTPKPASPAIPALAVDAAVAMAIDAPAPPPPDPPKTIDACGITLRHTQDLLKGSGRPELAAAAAAVGDDIPRCRTEHWPAVVLDCAFHADSPEQIADKCNKLAYAGAFTLAKKREFVGVADKNAIGWRLVGEDGDYFKIDDDCGLLAAERGGAPAMFVVCKGAVSAGPLTTSKEVSRALAAKSLASIKAGCEGCQISIQ